MKQKLLLLFILFNINLSETRAQFLYTDFDYPDLLNNFVYWNDSGTANRKWQIGLPDKTKFRYETWHKRVLCTDTVLTTHKADTFSLIIPFLRDPFAGVYEFSINFKYRMDGDSNDFGLVELSLDTGKTWINLLQEDTTYDIEWRNNQGNKPVLNGKVDSWSNFYADMTTWTRRYNNPKYPKKLIGVHYILFRLTYITDTIGSGNHDGWMIDDLTISNAYESVQSYYTGSGGFSFYPNPASHVANIRNPKETTVSRIDIYDLKGQRLLTSTGDNVRQIDISNLPDGIYQVLISSNGRYYVIRLVVGD